MKLTCTRESFQRGLIAVQNISHSKISNTINKSIWLVAEDDCLVMRATNLHMSVECKVACQIETPGQVIVPAEFFVGLVRTIADSEVILEENNNRLIVTSGKSEFSFQCYREEEFPEFPATLEGIEVNISAHHFRTIMGCTLFATTEQESRFSLNGVKVCNDEGVLTFVSTDGRRLSLVAEPNAEMDSTAEVSCVIDSRTLREVVRIVDKDLEKLEITFGQRRVMFKGNDIIITANLLEDSFPSYRRIIPEGGTLILKFNRKEMLAGVQRVSLLASGDSKMVKMSVSSGKIMLEGDNQQVGKATDEVECDYVGDPFVTGYNAHYLESYLQSFEEEQIVWEMQQPHKPAVFKGADAGTYLHMIMPIPIETQQDDNDE